MILKAEIPDYIYAKIPDYINAEEIPDHVNAEIPDYVNAETPDYINASFANVGVLAIACSSCQPNMQERKRVTFNSMLQYTFIICVYRVTSSTRGSSLLKPH